MALFKRKQKQEDMTEKPAEITQQSTIDASAMLNQEQPPIQKIGEKQIREALFTLQKYKEGKAMLEQKLIFDEEFWKLRQWGHSNADMTATPYLWTCIQSRYSDIMDSYPTCNLLPRQEDDKAEAKRLSSILPVELEQNKFEEVYSDIAWYALKHGGAVFGVFWDSSKYNGLGDITCKKIDFINLFWQPGITNIQESANVFNTELVDNNILEQRYPQTKGKLGGKRITLAKYLTDDRIDTTNKSVVVDWYYHTEYNGKKVLQYCKFVNDVVLFATENEPQNYPDGWYAHGLYPFVTFPLYPVDGSLCGMGLTDIGKDTQAQIDILSTAITNNAIVGSVPRHFIKNDGSVKEEEYNDLSKHLVHVEGSVNSDNIMPIPNAQLPPIYENVLNSKIEELKYCTSNQDANNGIAPSGITAASALAALQETAGKNSRSTNKVFHRAFREVISMMVELIRQFYNTPRVFRICPDTLVGDQYITYQNDGLAPQPQQGVDGEYMGLRTPEFDIEITSEKANPYKKMEINELALDFFNRGFFNPQMSDQALSCLTMMDFDHKQDIINMIQQNGTMYQNLLQYQQLALALAQQVSPQMAEQLSQTILSQGGQPILQGSGATGETPQALQSDASENGQEHPFVDKARQQARESTQAD